MVLHSSVWGRAVTGSDGSSAWGVVVTHVGVVDTFSLFLKPHALSHFGRCDALKVTSSAARCGSSLRPALRLGGPVGCPGLGGQRTSCCEGRAVQAIGCPWLVRSLAPRCESWLGNNQQSWLLLINYQELSKCWSNWSVCVLGVSVGREVCASWDTSWPCACLRRSSLLLCWLWGCAGHGLSPGCAWGAAAHGGDVCEAPGASHELLSKALGRSVDFLLWVSVRHLVLL